jgi:hypothetical protein
LSLTLRVLSSIHILPWTIQTLITYYLLKLHNEDGLALEYRDGSGIFAINGNIYGSMLEMKIQEKLK